MPRLLKVSLVAVIALAFLLVVMPTPASARVFVRGGIGWGGGWGWGPGWGMGWYGPGYGYWGPYGYYYGPPHGTVNITTHDKAAAVFIDGGYAGTVAEIHKFALRPGAHDLALRDPNGTTIYNQRVEVLRNKTTKIHVGT
jgi:hypothetical protein